MRHSLNSLLILVLVGCTAPDESSVQDPPAAPPEEDPEPAEPFSSDYAIEEATEASGLAFEAPFPDFLESQLDAQAGGGGSIADLDADGDWDVILVALHGDNAVFLNHGDGTFEQAVSPTLETTTGVRATTVADFNGDGFPDLLLHDRTSVRLLEGSGDGDFNEWPPLYEFAEDEGSVGASISDADGDGDLDIYLMMHERLAPGTGHELIAGADDRLLLGTGGFAFEDRTDLLEGAAPGATNGAAWLDVDEDGDRDLYVVRDLGETLAPNALFLNPGAPDEPWVEAAAEFGMDIALNGMGVAWADLDEHDGPEIAMSDTNSTTRLISVREEGAVDVTQALGASPEDDRLYRIGWGTEFVDMDDDGDQDLLVAWGHKDHNTFDEPPAPQPVSLHLAHEGRLHDHSAAVPSTTGNFHRAAMPADLDGDGFLDVVVTSLFGPTQVLRGQPTGNRHLEVRLRWDQPSNRDGLGSFVDLFDSADRHQRRALASGASGVHCSLPPIARFGLGDAEVTALVVEWPDGEVTTVEAADLQGSVTVGPDGLIED